MLRDKKALVLRILYVIYFIVLLALVTCKINEIYYYVEEGRYVHSIVREIKMNRKLGYWNYNFIPFEAYSYWISEHIWGSLILNILGNTMAFAPMGFFEMALSKHKKFWKVVLRCFIIVVSLEVFQFILCLGYLDIDDIIMNTIGCVLGCLLYYLFTVICQKAKNFFTH